MDTLLYSLNVWRPILTVMVSKPGSAAVRKKYSYLMNVERGYLYARTTFRSKTCFSIRTIFHSDSRRRHQLVTIDEWWATTNVPTEFKEIWMDLTPTQLLTGTALRTCNNVYKYKCAYIGKQNRLNLCQIA